jgi:hypothetical protein
MSVATYPARVGARVNLDISRWLLRAYWPLARGIFPVGPTVALAEGPPPSQGSPGSEPTAPGSPPSPPAPPPSAPVPPSPPAPSPAAAQSSPWAAAPPPGPPSFVAGAPTYRCPAFADRAAVGPADQTPGVDGRTGDVIGHRLRPWTDRARGACRRRGGDVGDQ